MRPLIRELLAAGSASWLVAPAPALLVGLVGVVALVILLLVYAGDGRGVGARLRRATRSVLSGADNRASTSKVVAAAWTLLIAWMLLSGAILKLAAGANLTDLAVSNDYLVLLGGPFASAVLAKGIVVTRLANGTLQKSAAPEDSKLNPGDVIRDDAGRTDLVDFQYALFNAVTLVVVAVMFLLHAQNGLPDVPAGLLALTGTAAAAYVANKAVTTGTPRITQVDPSSARPGQAVVLRGTNLIAPGAGASAQTPTVSVNDLPAPVIEGRAGPQAVTIRVPSSAPVSPAGAPATIVLVSDAAGLARAENTLAIEADSVVLGQATPATAAPGDLVTLAGRGFMAAQAMDPADGNVVVDPPVVLLAASATGGRPARDLARVSPNSPPPGSLPTDTSLTFVMPALGVDPATRLTVTVARGGLASQPLPMMLGARRSQHASHSAPVMGLSNVDASEGFALGVGVATISGERMPGAPAVAADPPNHPAGDDTGVYSQQALLTICQSSQEVASALNVSVDAEASYGALSASDKFQLAQKFQASEAHLFLVVHASAQSPLLTAGNVRLTSEAQQLIANSDFTKFLEIYGDAFVSGLITGGEYSAVLALTVKQGTTSQEIVNDFGLSGGVGELTASLQNKVTSTLSTRRDSLEMTMMVASRGGDPTKKPATGTDPADPTTATTAVAQNVSDVLGAARNFPASVTAGNAYPLTADLTEYLHLDLVNERGFLDYLEGDQGLDIPRAKLVDMSREHTAALGDLARARALLANPFGYAETPGEILRTFPPIIKTLQEFLRALPTRANEYAHDVARHGDSSDVQVPDWKRPPVAWPDPKPVPAYVIKQAFGDGTLVVAASHTQLPDAGDPTKPIPNSIKLAHYQPDDPSQLWLINQLGGGAFTMQNAFTQLYAAWPNRDQVLEQRSVIDESTKWRLNADGWITTNLSLPFMGSMGFLNAYGDGPWPEGTVIGIYHNGGDENSHFTVVNPDDLRPRDDAATPAKLTSSLG